METEEPQDPQIVLRDTRCRLADEAHAPQLEIDPAADIIVDRAVARDRERVHGEVAALRIAPPVAAERDLGATPVGLDILAQGGDLVRTALGNDRDGAMLDAGRHRL